MGKAVPIRKRRAASRWPECWLEQGYCDPMTARRLIQRCGESGSGDWRLAATCAYALRPIRRRDWWGTRAWFRAASWRLPSASRSWRQRPALCTSCPRDTKCTGDGQRFAWCRMVLGAPEKCESCALACQLLTADFRMDRRRESLWPDWRAQRNAPRHRQRPRGCLPANKTTHHWLFQTISTIINLTLFLMRTILESTDFVVVVVIVVVMVVGIL